MIKMLLAGTALAVCAASPAAARQLDAAKPEDALEIVKRAQCGTQDGAPAVYYWSGKVYSRVAGEPDRLLFGGEGMNIRTCVTVTDAKRGTGYRQVSREIMLFTDPKTGEILRNWSNPWTSEQVAVMHIANDPVNLRPQFPREADGKPFQMTVKRMGPWVSMPLEVPLFYPDPLGGAYQAYVGGQYHAMEIFDFAARASELLDTKVTTVQPSVSWVRISDWMPWMKMRGREGQLVFNAMGTKLTSFDELAAMLKNEIRASYPAYTQAPPTDDTRPNATTWTVFKQAIDQQRQSAPAATPPQH